VAGSVRLALLTNFIPPYRLPLLEHLQQRVKQLSVFVSTPMERNRRWPTDWGRLFVHSQRSIAISSNWHHPHGFTDGVTIHFPYDTIPQLVKFRPDVIISGELGARTLQAAVYRKLHPSSRLVIWATLSEISEQGRGGLRNLVRPSLLRAADAIIVNGDGGARYVQKCGARSERVFRIPYATELRPFLSQKLVRDGEDRQRLIYSGQLIERKGLVPFLTHLAAYAAGRPGRHFQFWLAGDGPLRRVIGEFHRPANLEIRMLGHVDYHRLPDLYSQSGILAFPTIADEWGVAVVEAMAAGLPVLGSAYSQAVEELVRDGQNGWIFRPDDPKEVRDALTRAFDAPAEHLDQMAECARLSVLKLDPVSIADRIMDVIDHALAHCA
jgi:glycosyltransferase involved in cell wall biosynthesis